MSGATPTRRACAIATMSRRPWRAEPQGRSRQHLPRRGSGHRGAGNRRASASGRGPRSLVQGQNVLAAGYQSAGCPGPNIPLAGTQRPRSRGSASRAHRAALATYRHHAPGRHFGGRAGSGGRAVPRFPSWSQARGDLKKAVPPGVTTRAARRGRDGRCRGRGRGRLHRPKGARYPACAPHEVVGRKFEHRRTGVNQVTPGLAYAVRAPRSPWHGSGCLASKRRRRRWRRLPPGNPL